MTSEPEELLKLIDGHIEANLEKYDDLTYIGGMNSIRWLVYNFLNSPRPAGEPSPLTEEELKMLTPEEEEVEDAGTKDFSL